MIFIRFKITHDNNKSTATRTNAKLDKVADSSAESGLSVTVGCEAACRLVLDASVLDLFYGAADSKLWRRSESQHAPTDVDRLSGEWWRQDRTTHSLVSPRRYLPLSRLSCADAAAAADVGMTNERQTRLQRASLMAKFHSTRRDKLCHFMSS